MAEGEGHHAKDAKDAKVKTGKQKMRRAENWKGADVGLSEARPHHRISLSPDDPHPDPLPLPWARGERLAMRSGGLWFYIRVTPNGVSKGRARNGSLGPASPA